MNPATSIDATPAIRMALVGAVIALVPLAWTWWRRARAGGALRGGHAMSWLRALTLTTLVLTFDLVLFGSFTRLTDSGLGCPDWPGCYGHASPLGAKSSIDAAVATQPDGPVTHAKAWIEMIHRYFAMAVGALIVVMTFEAWRTHRWAPRLGPRATSDDGRESSPRGAASSSVRAPAPSPRSGPRSSSPWWPTVTLAWVIAQGAFGALTVTMRLYPAVVTVHLLLGLGLLALLAVQAERSQDAGALAIDTAIDTPTRRLAWVFAWLLLAQVALGGWVSTNYAVLACTDFPTCQGQWWPPMDFGEGFTLRRELGRSGSGGAYLPFAALTAIHVAHRIGALVLVVVAVALAWQLGRSAAPGARRLASWLAVLVVWQVATGASNVVLGWPIVAALAHVAGAAGMTVVVATLLERMRAARPATCTVTTALRAAAS